MTTDTPMTDAHEEETWGVLTSWKSCNEEWRGFSRALERQLSERDSQLRECMELLEKWAGVGFDNMMDEETRALLARLQSKA